MHLDERLFTDLFVDQELCHELTLVALKLHDVSVFRILNDASVAVEPLFAFLEDDILVDLRIDSLRGRTRTQRRASVTGESTHAPRRTPRQPVAPIDPLPRDMFVDIEYQRPRMRCATHDSHLCGSSTFRIVSSESVSTRNGSLEISVARRARAPLKMEDEESHSRRSLFVLYI